MTENRSINFTFPFGPVIYFWDEELHQERPVDDNNPANKETEMKWKL